MKLNKSILITATILVATLATPAWLSAQHPRYKLIDLGPFNGGLQSYLNIPNSYAPVLNDAGVVAGWADTAAPDPYPSFCFNEDCFVSHAFQSRNGVTTDLGALPGGASSASTWISVNGLIAGFSENGDIDPLSPGFPQFRAVVWKDGRITDLGTLPDGGYESIANAVNSRGQVVGLATNTIPDNFSLFGPTQSRAFLWQDGVMQDLGTLGGTDAMALFINEEGQIVGESYTNAIPSAYCSNNLGFLLTTGAFIWENGEMKDLGNFGGTCTFATDLNNRGEVIGISSLFRDQTQHAFLWDGSLHELPNTIGGNNAAPIQINEGGDVVGWASVPGNQVIHASLWKNGIMTDLGTLGADPCSGGSSVNAAEQVVGNSYAQVVGILVPSCDFSKSTAFLWQKGSMVDLNTLIPADSTLHLAEPETINDRGEIAGIGVDVANGDEHAFLLVPCSANDTECQNAPSGPAFVPAPATSKPGNNQNNSIRRMFRRPLRSLNKIPDPSTSSVPSGSGTTTTAAITGANATLSPTSMTFECRNIINTGCECFTERTATLSNSGTATLDISNFTITGPFSEANNCGTSLGAGKSCSISVHWSERNGGGFLSVFDNGSGSPQKTGVYGIKFCTPL
jgi:probable HAF family extracellular repeat protein